jgi:hypothetical protein
MLIGEGTENPSDTYNSKTAGQYHAKIPRIDQGDLTPHIAAPELIIQPLYKHTSWAFCDSMSCVA